MLNIELSEFGEIILSCDELSRFARRKSGAPSVKFTPSAAPYGDRDVFSDFSYRTICRGEVFIVRGEPDGLYTFGDECIVEMRKAVKKLTPSTNPASDPEFLAKSFVTADLVCKKKSRRAVTLKITLEAGGVEKHFDFPLESELLAKITDDLITRASFFAIAEKNFRIRGKQDIKDMPFPYPSIRDGQIEFVKETYRAAKRGGRLLVSAPTGIGKTVSALFPSVKALGDGIFDKVFYLTAKTVTGVTAAKCVAAMAKSAPDLRAVTVTAKERCCPSNDKKIDFSVDMCSRECPRLGACELGDYNSRRDAALTELLSDGPIFGKETISAVAEKYFLCPYELSLDLSEYCAVVICDYNYVFDPRVKFRRYFTEGDLKYSLLIDEAHNLPDRTREMFSAAITSREVSSLLDLITEQRYADAELISKCGELTEALNLVRELCRENSEAHADRVTGYYVGDSVPKKLSASVEKLNLALRRARNNAPEELKKAFDGAYTLTSDFMKSCEYFDSRFVFYAENNGDDLEIKIICVDPSEIIGRALSGAVTSVLFSATLTPLDYFADITSSSGAVTLELESPYPEENLCVAAVDTVSTKYISRGDTANEIADMIVETISAREGHYIVYFPSYKYMQTVFSAFSKIAPKGISAVVQKQGMSIPARNKFLSFFESNEGGTLVGFCVLGGIFSEGIDLPDERLIGAVLVGIGLPSLSSELNILMEYFEKTRENGYDFAYLYPAMIKIAQAAGRVIRGEGDRGVVVLIDDRYRDPNIIKLLPAHMRRLHYTGDSRSLRRHLERFWEK